MNTLSKTTSSVQRLALLGILLTAPIGIGRAANTQVFWDATGTNASQGGNGTWDAGGNSNTVWDTSATGGTLETYPSNGDPSNITATFGGTAAQAETATVTIAASTTVNVNNITFNNLTTGTTNGYSIVGGAGGVLNFAANSSATGPSINFSSTSTRATISANLSNDTGTGLTINMTNATGDFLFWNGANTGLTGTTTLNLNSGTIGATELAANGAVNGATNNSFGSSALQFTSNGGINFRYGVAAGTINFGNNVIINGGNATFNVGDQASSGDSGNTIFDFGTLTFDTANEFIFAGSLTTLPSDRIVFSNVVLSANGTLAFDASAGISSVGAVSQTGSTAFNLTVTTIPGITGGTLNITGASTYLGTTNITGTMTVDDGIANALPTSTTVNLTAGTLNLNGFNQQVAGLSSAGTVTTDFINNSTATTATLTYNGATSTFGGIIEGSKLGVTMAGGNLTLTGTNTYAGATTVSAGTLAIGSTGSLAAGSAVTINGGILSVAGKVNGTVALNSGGTLSGNGGTIGALTVAGGGIINTEDGVIGTLNGSTLALNGNATLDLDISTSSTADLLNFTGAATIGATDVFTVNINALTGAGTGTYTIASALSGLVAADFSAGTLTGLTGDTATFQLGSGDTIQLVIASSNPPNTNYYFTGTNSGSFTDASNYSTAATGGTSQTGNPLSATSNVFLDANSVSNTPPTLASTATINSLTFVTAGETLAGSTGNLTVEAGGGAGITDSATGGTTETIQPEVTLGASQTWAVTTSSNTLAVSGGIAGTSAQTLTLTGPGKYVFSSGATGTNFAGNTTLSSGSLFITNGNTGSALGTGTFTVARGATFGGAGSATGMAAFSIGNTGSGTTQIQVGNGTDTSSKLTLAANGASTISNANLTFNLSTTSTAANQLNLGNTAITFSNTTLTLNMTGGQIVSPNTAYVLITDANGFANSGLQLSGNVITGGLTIAANAFFGAESNGISTGFYNGSYLFLADNGTELDVEVVPEPGTWALMLGGLGMLFFWQRRRKALRV